MNIGQRIKRARLAFRPKMTQQQLADAVGISRPAVTQWETGEIKTLEGENLVRVARALQVSIDWLLYGSGVGPGGLAATTEDQAAAEETSMLLNRDERRMILAYRSLSDQKRDALREITHSLAESRADYRIREEDDSKKG